MGFNEMPPTSLAKETMKGKGAVTVEEIYKDLGIDPTHVTFFSNGKVKTLTDMVNVDKEQWFMISNHIGG